MRHKLLILLVLIVTLPLLAQITGPNASFWLRDTNQTLPNGLWRLYNTGNRLYVEKNTAAANNFSTVERITIPATTTTLVGTATGTVTDANVVFSDITTNDCTILKHGYAPKAPNDVTKFLSGDCSWRVASTGTISGTLTSPRVPFASGATTLVDDADMTFATDTLTVTKLVGSTSITNSGLTAARLVFSGAAGLEADDSDLTFATDTLTATKLITPTSITDTGLAPGGFVTANGAGLLGATASVSANSGGTAINTSGSTGVVTVNAGTWAVGSGNIVTSSVGPHAIGGSTVAALAFRLTGAWAVASGEGLYLDYTMTPGAGNPSIAAGFFPTLVEASSGTHSRLTALQVQPSVTAGAGTTDAANAIEILTFAAAGGTTVSNGLLVAAPSGATTNWSINSSGKVQLAGLTTSGAATATDLCLSANEVIADSALCVVSARRFKNSIVNMKFGSEADRRFNETALTVYAEDIILELTPEQKNVMAALTVPQTAVSSATELLRRLRPVNYFLNEPGDLNQMRQQFGYVAEEVEALDNRLVTYQRDGRVRSVQYLQVIPVLNKGFQELEARVAALEAK